MTPTVTEELVNNFPPGFDESWGFYRVDYDGLEYAIWMPRASRTEFQLLLGCRSAECPGDTHRLPIGAVVIYEDCDCKYRAEMIVVQHSRDCDGTPLYMVGQTPVSPPEHVALYSLERMLYLMQVGWFEGNVGSSSLCDTGERVAVEPFDCSQVARLEVHPDNQR